MVLVAAWPGPLRQVTCQIRVLDRELGLRLKAWRQAESLPLYLEISLARLMASAGGSAEVVSMYLEVPGAFSGLLGVRKCLNMERPRTILVQAIHAEASLLASHIHVSSTLVSHLDYFTLLAQNSEPRLGRNSHVRQIQSHCQRSFICLQAISHLRNILIRKHTSPRLHHPSHSASFLIIHKFFQQGL